MIVLCEKNNEFYINMDYLYFYPKQYESSPYDTCKCEKKKKKKKKMTTLKVRATSGFRVAIFR